MEIDSCCMHGINRLGVSRFRKKKCKEIHSLHNVLLPYRLLLKTLVFTTIALLCPLLWPCCRGSFTSVVNGLLWATGPQDRGERETKTGSQTNHRQRGSESEAGGEVGAGGSVTAKGWTSAGGYGRTMCGSVCRSSQVGCGNSLVLLVAEQIIKSI